MKRFAGLMGVTLANAQVNFNKDASLNITEIDVFVNRTGGTVHFDGLYGKLVNATAPGVGYLKTVRAGGNVDLDENAGDLIANIDLSGSKAVDIEGIASLLRGGIGASRKEDLTLIDNSLEATWTEQRNKTGSYTLGDDVIVATGDYQRNHTGSKTIAPGVYNVDQTINVIRDKSVIEGDLLNITQRQNTWVNETSDITEANQNLELAASRSDQTKVKYDGPVKLDTDYQLHIEEARLNVVDADVLKAALLGTDNPLLKALYIEMRDEVIH